MQYYKRLRLCYMEAAAITLVVCAFLFPSIQFFKNTGNNFFTIKLNGVEVGKLDSTENIDTLVMAARRRVAAKGEDGELVFVDTKVETSGTEELWGVVDGDDTVVENMAKVMDDSVRKTLHRSYTVKINETAVNLGSYDDVRELLERALSQYDAQGLYKVGLELDSDREINVLEAVVSPEGETAGHELPNTSAGAASVMGAMFEPAKPSADKGFEEYDSALTGIDYADKIEVVEAYLLEDELHSVDEAVDLVTGGGPDLKS